jgi:hypothetical protein
MRRADLTDLTAYVAVADDLSFRAAASRIGFTPSAVSPMRGLLMSVFHCPIKIRGD